MTPERICAFYSHGPHYVRMLRCLRENYPDATLVAAIPETFPFDVIASLADETVRVPDRDGLGALAHAWTVTRRLRQARCNRIAVMFDSFRLNLLSRARRTWSVRLASVVGRTGGGVEEEEQK